jgi:hypothetical protein
MALVSVIHVSDLAYKALKIRTETFVPAVLNAVALFYWLMAIRRPSWSTGSIVGSGSGMSATTRVGSGNRRSSPRQRGEAVWPVEALREWLPGQSGEVVCLIGPTVRESTLLRCANALETLEGGGSFDRADVHAWRHAAQVRSDGDGVSGFSCFRISRCCAA